MACLLGLPALADPPSGDDLGACRAEGAQVRIRKDHWTEINAPKVDAGEGPRKIVDYATPPYARSRIYATNGTVLKVSADAGCTWSTMHNAAQLEKLHSDKTAQDVYTNLAAPTNGALWAASYDRVGGVEHPHVYAATGLDDQNVASPSFIEISNGMAPAGRPVALVGSVTQQNLVYALIEGPAPDPASGDLQTPARHLYVAYTPNPQLPPAVPVPAPGTALGAMWKELALPAGFSHVQGITPAVGSNGLWLWSGSSYAMAPDTLADSVAWTTVKAPGEVTAIDVDFYGNPLVAYKSGQGGAARVIGDKGTFSVRGLPTDARLLVHGSRPGVYAVSSPRGTFGYDLAAKRWVDITPKGVPAFTKMQMPNGRLGRIVLAQAGDTFYRFDTYAGELFLEPPPLPDGIGDWPTVPGGDQTQPTLTPVKQVVTVKPGDVQDVQVDFRVPAAPNPLNVYFLLDTTGSMGPAVAGLKASIANISQRLHKVLGKNACFGLGDFRDFYPGETQHTYLRDLPITCEKPVERMQTALDNLPPAAGGANIPEAQTIALTQAVTGNGQKLPDPPVNPRQEAGFRADAFKVIVLISDSSFYQTSGYPTKAATINTLNVADVKVVSALVTTAEGDHDNARQDMEEIADGTRTYAPAQGVDCDGNHRMSVGDLPPGAPLVCEAGGGSDANIGPAIVSLLLGVTDPGTLAVDVHDSNRVVQQIKGRTSQVVNLKQPSGLSFALPVRCSQAQDGLDLPIGLLPTVRAVPVGLYGEVIVRCRSALIVPPPVPPAPRPQEEPFVDVPRLPRPPVAAAVVQPPPAPAQPLSNINPNAGFSQQEEQQFQLAAVTQGAADQEDPQEEVELAMSDHRARDAAAGGYVLGGGMMLSSAVAVAYRRRLQRATRTRTVRV
jgi:hypothetical protein